MIDLSSDTATKPTAAMHRAMAGAEVGDKQRGEDPSVNRLFAMVAGGLRVRAVTHIDVSRQDVEEAVGATRAVLDDARRRTRSTSLQGSDAAERQREGKENEHAVR
jgi:threonine aldolase